ncbi:MAG: cellulose synthase family protein [Maricaulaceae bacterium]
MSIIAILILSIHYTLISLLCIYGAHRIYHSLVAKQLIGDLVDHKNMTFGGLTFLPKVTVQVPLYNEKFVAARIINRIVEFEYPREKLHIQVINDSTDESVNIVAERVRHYQNLGYDISHIRRNNRDGYKAGALAAAMSDVKGDFIAIFDADFLPETDFLLKTIHHFQDPKVGLVQSRWSYLNSKVNTLTRLQSIMLDAHFGIEQVARSGQGAYFNFNGTGGIWRKETIMDAGGWTSDTLTEDTDLSYRAQMRGWKFIYRPEICSPSEIPESMSAFKVQQHRWAKGTIEVMKKILPNILRAKISLRNKIEATLHLTANITYLLMFVDSLFFLLPSVHIRQEMGANYLTWLDLPIFAFASLSHAYFFMSGQKRLYGRMIDKLYILPTLLATSIGLGVNNGRAVIEALIGYKTGFVRTPKVGHQSSNASLNTAYKTHSEMWSTLLELFLAIIYTAFLIWAISQSYWIVIPFMALFAIGFFYISLLSLKEKSANKKLSYATALPQAHDETEKTLVSAE